MNNQKITTKTVPITPYRLFQMQIKGTYGAFTSTTENYLPPSLGGIEGQRRVLQQGLVMTVADFKVGNE